MFVTRVMFFAAEWPNQNMSHKIKCGL